MSLALRLTITVTLLGLGVALPGWGQEPVRESPLGSVEEVAPTTVYLKDEKGNLVPVPDFSYERYRELLLLEKRVAGAEPPSFSVEKLDLSGVIKDETAQINAEVTVLTRKAGWTMIPLRMSGAVLRDEISGDSEGLVHRYDAKEGHVVWLEGTADQRHRMKLPLIVRVTRAANEEIISLPLPKSSESQLTLESGYKVAQASLNGGYGLASTKGTQISVAGAEGDLVLTWQAATTSMRSTGLESSAEIAVRLEARDMISLDAAFRATRVGNAIRRLYVRLPPNTEAAGRTGRGFTITPATSQELADDGIPSPEPLDSPVVRVDFDRPADSVEFSVGAAYKPGDQGKPRNIEVGGFEILGGGRQTGYISVFLPSGWSMKATTSAVAFRTDEETSLPGQPRAQARYRFVRQPFSMLLEAAPQPPRTEVESTYFAAVEAQRVTLAGTLDYQVRGPRPEYLDLEIGDWTLDAIGPESLVEFETPPEPGKPVRMTLLPGMQSEFSVQVQLHREVPADSVMLAFDLPRAVATRVQPSTLTITSADNIALSPSSDELRSLVPEERTLSATSSPTRQLLYREVQSTEPARFVAGLQVRQRRVTAMIEGRLQVGGRQAAVEQRMRLDIAYEPLGFLMLEAPASAGLSTLQVFKDEQLLDLREEALSDAPGQTPAVRHWRVELPEPTTGSLMLVVQYEVTVSADEHINVPLVTLVESASLVVARQQLQIESPADQRLLLGDAHTDEPGLSSHESTHGLEVAWPRKASLLQLHRSADRPSIGPTLRIEKQWLQVWLSTGVRRDRFVAGLSGVQERFSVLLPPGVPAEEVRVLIDGAAPRNVSLQEQRLSIEVGPGDDSRTLELWYLLPGPSASIWPQRHSLPVPRIAGAATPRESWIQIVTPATDQVLYASFAAVPQMTWRKRSWLWQRAGARTTEELVDWLGATTSPEPFPLDANDALFVTLGPVANVEVVVGGRRWMWIFIGGGVLCAGLVIHYLSRGRSWVVMAALAAAGCLLAVFSPELALNLSQVVGVALLLLVAVIWSMRTSGRSEPATAVTVAPGRGSDSRAVRRDPSSTNAVLAPAARELHP